MPIVVTGLKAGQDVGSFHGDTCVYVLMPKGAVPS